MSWLAWAAVALASLGLLSLVIRDVRKRDEELRGTIQALERAHSNEKAALGRLAVSLQGFSRKVEAATDVIRPEKSGSPEPGIPEGTTMMAAQNDPVLSRGKSGHWYLRPHKKTYGINLRRGRQVAVPAFHVSDFDYLVLKHPADFREEEAESSEPASPMQLLLQSKAYGTASGQSIMNWPHVAYWAPDKSLFRNEPDHSSLTRTTPGEFIRAFDVLLSLQSIEWNLPPKDRPNLERLHGLAGRSKWRDVLERVKDQEAEAASA